MISNMFVQLNENWPLYTRSYFWIKFDKNKMHFTKKISALFQLYVDAICFNKFSYFPCSPWGLRGRQKVENKTFSLLIGKSSSYEIAFIWNRTKSPVIKRCICTLSRSETNVGIRQPVDIKFPILRLKQKNKNKTKILQSMNAFKTYIFSLVCLKVWKETK